jgi:S-sulfo-L-cysteine synthase (O-acetyl-L-serine-dependent)
LVGNTPLLPLSQFSPKKDVEIWAKAEWFNPGGSVKDRAALSIVREAERRGRLDRRTTLIDATSGNTGIAYAMFGAAKGFPVRLCLPSSASVERKRILHAFGAELELTDPQDGSDGAIRRVRELVERSNERLYYADQYSNPANPRAHERSTAPEIWRQTRGRVTHFVAGLGTSGTLMGTGRGLRRRKKSVKLVAVQPDAAFHGLEGLKHMETAIVPAIFDARFPDATIPVGTEAAQAAVRRLAREAGLLVGVSSGAALVGAIEVAKTIKKGVVVTLFPDGGDKYLSERFWEARG